MNETYVVLRNAISKELCNFIKTEVELIEKVINYTGQNTRVEKGHEESFSMYGLFCYEALSLHLKPLIEQTLGKTLYPTYTYGRVYRTGATLVKHIDRASSEYTLSCCIEKDPTDWLLAVEDTDGNVSEILLNQGDILLYKGRSNYHWRVGEFKGKEQLQIFVQYVDANGDSADLKYDKRAMLGLECPNIV
jgi:alkylated DNA repair dioxygenase AlkB